MESMETIKRIRRITCWVVSKMDSRDYCAGLNGKSVPVGIFMNRSVEINLYLNPAILLPQQNRQDART